jgi:hypothetical protein
LNDGGRDLHERLEKFYKVQLKWLKDQNHYDPQNETDRYVVLLLSTFFTLRIVHK